MRIPPFFKTPKAVVIVIVMVIVGVLFLSRSVPAIATVNGASISKARFTRNYDAVLVYHENAMKIYSTTSTPIIQPTERALQAEVLMQLVDAALIDEVLQKELADDLDILVEERTARHEGDADLAEKTETLYGLSLGAFKEEVLIPQAKRDILAGRLYLKGDKVESWLIGARKNAKVEIFSPDFVWDGAKVVPVNP